MLVTGRSTKRIRGLLAAFAVVLGLLAIPTSASAAVVCDTRAILDGAQQGSVASYPTACLDQAIASISDQTLYPELVQRIEAAKQQASDRVPSRTLEGGQITPVTSAHSPLAAAFDAFAPSGVGELPAIVLVLTLGAGLLVLGGLLSAVSRSRSRARAS